MITEEAVFRARSAPDAVAAWAATPGPPARPRPSSGLPPPRIKIPYFFATIAH